MKKVSSVREADISCKSLLHRPGVFSFIIIRFFELTCIIRTVSERVCTN